MQVVPTKAFNLALTDSVGLKVLKSFHQTQRRRKSFIGKMKRNFKFKRHFRKRKIIFFLLMLTQKSLFSSDAGFWESLEDPFRW